MFVQCLFWIIQTNSFNYINAEDETWILLKYTSIAHTSSIASKLLLKVGGKSFSITFLNIALTLFWRLSIFHSGLGQLPQWHLSICIHPKISFRFYFSSYQSHFYDPGRKFILKVKKRSINPIPHGRGKIEKKNSMHFEIVMQPTWNFDSVYYI